MTPAVSIVIPNYNYARFLDQRFRSILEQTWQDYEIIFLDDASTDDSVTLAKDRFGSRIKEFVVNASNSGNPFVQWNRGVRLARGEFVWIAEADDSCTPDFLERMLAAISRAPSIGLAYCNTTPIDIEGNILDKDFFLNYVSTLDTQRWHGDFQTHGATELRQFMAKRNTITNVSGALFRREAYEKTGGAPEDMRMCGDWLTYCRILREWDVAYLSTPMNFHRQHPAKHTQNSVLDLTYFREFLAVQDYVAANLDLAPNERRAALHRFLGEWDRLTVSHYGRIPLDNTARIASVASAHYRRPGERLQIAGHLVVNSIKSMVGKWLPV